MGQASVSAVAGKKTGGLCLRQMNKLVPFIQFSRPHTIIATTFQAVGLFIIVGAGQDVELTELGALIATFVSSLAINIYVVGFNQITDVEIDRINKPSLPLAAGSFSMPEAKSIVVVAGLLAFILAASQGIYLLLTITIVFTIGTLYSWRPVHLKQYPFWAALSIALVRGVVSNLGLYWHFNDVLGQPVHTPPPLIIWALVFFFGFGLVIALYKDIPDLEGDRLFTIRTFTVQMGPNKVFRLGRWILTGFYLTPIFVGFIRLPQLDGFVLALTHLAVLSLFWAVSLQINPTDAQSMTRFYFFLWGLFYLEYVLLSVHQIAPTLI
jgi:homogentisate phytyltransferase/homogentisate geranylgeranyltransferase